MAIRGRSAPPSIAAVGRTHILKRATACAASLIEEPKPCRLMAAGTISGSVDGWLCYHKQKILGEVLACICPLNGMTGCVTPPLWALKQRDWMALLPKGLRGGRRPEEFSGGN